MQTSDILSDKQLLELRNVTGTGAEIIITLYTMMIQTTDSEEASSHAEEIIDLAAKMRDDFDAEVAV